MLPRGMMERIINILGHILSGLSDTDINTRYGYSRGKCREIRHLLHSDPVAIFQLFRPIGAPLKVTFDMFRRIEELTLSDRRMSNEFIAIVISAEFHISISSETVRKARKDLGFKFKFPIHTFDLTDVQRENRLKFAQSELANWRDWSKVVFTDESYFCLGEDYRRLWRRPGERCKDICMHTKKFPQKLLIFGGITSGFKSRIVILGQKSGTVNGAMYVEKLIPESEIIPRMNSIHGPFNWTLMQDGAPAHMKQSTIEYLNAQCNLIDWPSGSPDLNPIENLWSIMKSRVAELGPKTIGDLEQIVTDIWYSVTEAETQNLIDSIRHRLEACVAAGGGPNGY
jgi:transposase